MIPFVIACANDTSGPTSANANTEAEPNTGADAPTCTDSLQNQNETGVDCGGPCNPCSVLATGQFTHPGALDSQQELDFVKAQIEAGAEPWKSEYDRLVNSTPARWRPHGLSEIDSQGADANTSRDDANAAYAQALLWYYSGDETYAKRSIAILNAWADLQGFTAGSDQDKLQAGWIGAIFAPAAEIMRAYPGWAAEDVEKLQAMFRRAFYPQLDRASSWNGNVDLTQIDAMMAIAVFNEDIELFNAGIERWQKRTHSYFYLESDGEVPAISGDGNNVQSFWSKPTAWVDGLTQETCRDNGHHAQFAIGSAIHAAEVAWHQGVDLYTGESERYTATLELMATQLLTGDMQGTCADNTASKSLFDTWEVAYNHYHNRMGIDLPQTRALIETKIRPNAPRAVWNLAYETLTHAGF